MSVDEAIEEKVFLEKRMIKLQSSIKLRKITQDKIDRIDEILKIM
jgi:hypothetical protein